MQSWQKHLKDYEIIEWNEKNFNINSNPFVKQAYKAKKWAYVSDYIRMYAIYKYGGIYLDTDVLVLNNFDDFLNNKAFVGFENPNYPFTAVFGSIPKHNFIKKVLDYYDRTNFEFDKSNQLKNVNTKIVSNILINEYNCKLNNKKQVLKDDIMVYPDYILCNPSKHSVSIHIFTGTWMEGKKPVKRKIIKFIKLRLTTKKLAYLYKKFIANN